MCVMREQMLPELVGKRGHVHALVDPLQERVVRDELERLGGTSPLSTEGEAMASVTKELKMSMCVDVLIAHLPFGSPVAVAPSFSSLTTIKVQINCFGIIVMIDKMGSIVVDRDLRRKLSEFAGGGQIFHGRRRARPASSRGRGGGAGRKRQRTECGTWQEFEDEQGNLFYYNESTGISQWERPAGSFIPIGSPIDGEEDVEGAAKGQNGQVQVGEHSGALKSPYRLESKLRLLEEGYQETDVPGGTISGMDADKQPDANQKQRKKRKRKPRRLKTKMSLREFRKTAGKSYIYTVWPCLSIVIVVVGAAIIILHGLTSDAEIPQF